MTHVYIPRPVLGLSLGIDANNMMLGEVIREFEQVITSAVMYNMDFTGVLGMQSIQKDSCYLVGDVILLEVPVGIGDYCVEVLVSIGDYIIEAPANVEDCNVKGGS